MGGSSILPEREYFTNEHPWHWSDPVSSEKLEYNKHKEWQPSGRSGWIYQEGVEACDSGCDSTGNQRHYGHWPFACPLDGDHT